MLIASTPNTTAATGAAGANASAPASEAEACPLGNVFARMLVRLTQNRLNRRTRVRSTSRRLSTAHGGRACSQGSVPKHRTSAVVTIVQNRSADPLPLQTYAAKPAEIIRGHES